MIIYFYKLRPTYHPFPLFSWAIMVFQGMLPWKKNAYSHMAMGFHSETGALKIADVPFAGAREMTGDAFFKKYDKVDIKKRTYGIDRIEFLKWLESHEHKVYDHKQILGLALKILNIRGFNKSGSNFEKLICSELILSFLVEFDGLKLNDPDNWDLHMTWDAI